MACMDPMVLLAVDADRRHSWCVCVFACVVHAYVCVCVCAYMRAVCVCVSALLNPFSYYNNDDYNNDDDDNDNK